MKSWGNGFEELLVNSLIAVLIIDVIMILGDWFYYIPNQIDYQIEISSLTIIDIILLVILVIYIEKTSTTSSIACEDD